LVTNQLKRIFTFYLLQRQNIIIKELLLEMGGGAPGIEDRTVDPSGRFYFTSLSRSLHSLAAGWLPMAAHGAACPIE
jgi:hypothetical protein